MKKFILLILVLATFLRTYRLSSVPPSPSLDEASIGYNAYSILKTGNDEYGYRFPILLRAYDDWRPAGYAYLTLPFVGLLGLTVKAVRLPSVIMSVVTIWLVYVWFSKLFQKQKEGEAIALIVALLVAISPWHIYLSRLGHEVNAGLFTVVLGGYFLIKFLGAKQSKWIIGAAVAFALSFYTYQSEKLVVPMLVVAATLLFFKEFWKVKKYTLAAVIVGLVISLPAVIASLSPEGLIRLRATSVFSSAADTRLVTKVGILASQYLTHFSPGWLFTGGAAESHKVPGLGPLWFWEAPFILLGAAAFLRSALDRRMKAFLLVWFLSAPLPAAISNQVPHAMRAFTFLPIWQLFGAFGLVTFFVVAAKRVRREYLWLLASIVISVSVGYFMRQYFDVFRRQHSSSFQYALAHSLQYSMERDHSYRSIIVSNSAALYQSYMFYLFFSGFDPATYQRFGGTVSGGYAETHRIGKYLFRPIDWIREKIVCGNLYLDTIETIPKDRGVTRVVNNLDAVPAIGIVDPCL